MSNKYHINPITKELDGFSPYEEGTPLSSYETLVIPKSTAANKALVFNGNEWEYHHDYRGQVVYDWEVLGGNPTEITEIGSLPLTGTLVAPNTPFDKWTDSGWSSTHPEALTAARVAAQLQIDNAAAEVQHRYGQFEIEYLTRERQARAWLADNTVTDISFVESVATYSGITMRQACELVISQADMARQALDYVQKARMSKLAMNSATAVSQIETIKAGALDAIKRVSEALE